MNAAPDPFERHRGRLRGLAYRMLGSVADADDVLQDAYLRWHGAASTGEAIREPAAWLTTTVTRLCLDRLRAAQVERAAYVGPWLPDPWIDVGERPDARQDRADDLSVAFMLMLERLSAEERAAFLLHDVFDVDYPMIAEALGKSEAACRQTVHRARERVRAGRPRFAASDTERRALLDRFIAAGNAGDEAELLTLLAPDATFTSDGGGKIWAALNVIHGADRIARMAAGLARKLGDLDYRPAILNGMPAVIAWRDGKPVSTTAVDVDGGRIRAVYRVLNPDKLRHLA